MCSYFLRSYVLCKFIDIAQSIEENHLNNRLKNDCELLLKTKFNIFLIRNSIHNILITYFDYINILKTLTYCALDITINDEHKHQIIRHAAIIQDLLNKGNKPMLYLEAFVVGLFNEKILCT